MANRLFCSLVPAREWRDLGRFVVGERDLLSSNREQKKAWENRWIGGSWLPERKLERWESKEVWNVLVVESRRQFLVVAVAVAMESDDRHRCSPR